MTPILLDFGSFSCDAALFDQTISREIEAHLPLDIDLTGWGSELYGPTGLSLAAIDPVPAIPPGGIAYSERGGYLCIFFGQNPAWPVDHIGAVSDKDIPKLRENPHPRRVIVTLEQEDRADA